jgi:hypothetical protein
MKISPVESFGANEDFSFVGDILAVILETSTPLIDSNGSMASGGQDSGEDTLPANAHVSSRESQNEHDPGCFLILCCYGFICRGCYPFLSSQAWVANETSAAYSYLRFHTFCENEDIGCTANFVSSLSAGS